MRKTPRKAVLENVAIFKRDAKKFEFGQFDVKSDDKVYKTIAINEIGYGVFSYPTLSMMSSFNTKYTTT